jgi:hypothetical protein
VCKTEATVMATVWSWVVACLVNGA